MSHHSARNTLSRFMVGRIPCRALSCLTLSVVLTTSMGLAGCQEHVQWLAQEQVLNPLPPPIVLNPARPPPVPRPVLCKTLRDTTIVVDPGHGGRDPGAMPKYRGQLREKDINLSIASQVEETLRSRGARVIMTRTSDIFLELEDRARIADRYRADLFVSIHADSAPKRFMSGAGVHIYTKADRETQTIAQCIVSALRRSGIHCRGVFRSNFHVLREHERPGVLIEAGFLTNSADAERLNSAGYRARLATAIAEGITDHFGTPAAASSR
jgi:N-acetylmuramoyl-L-alanine amidase